MRLRSFIIDTAQELMIDLHDHDRDITVEWFRFKRDAVLQSQRLKSGKDLRFHPVLAAGAAVIFQQVVP